jgi:hypothetical protein
MAFQLKNIKVTHVSLVHKAANRRTVILKADTEDRPDLREVTILKLDAPKKMVFGIVYAPDELDTQGDMAKQDDIELAAHEFMKTLSLHNVDRDHSFKNEQAFVAESWIVRKGDELFGADKIGSWAVGIKVQDDALWASIEKGDITGLSMAGTADKIQLSKSDEGDTLVARIITAMKAAFTKQFKEIDAMEKQDIQKMIDESITEAVKDLPAPLTKEQMAEVFKAAVEPIAKPLTERLDKIEKASPGSKQDDETIRKEQEDLHKLGAEIAKIINDGR